MPTVDELIELVARESGLDDTSGSEERDICLDSLNRALRRVAMEAKRLVPATLDVTATIDTVLATAAPTLVELNSVSRVDGARELPLDRTSPERLYAMRYTDGGTPTTYAVEHGTLLLDAVETVNPSTIRLRYTARPAALVDGGSEASIQGVDPIYHEDLLGTLAVAYVLEGNEGEEQRAAYFRGLVYGEGGTMQMFKRAMIREGGVYNPRGDDPTRWDTPSNRSAR